MALALLLLRQRMVRVLLLATIATLAVAAAPSGPGSAPQKKQSSFRPGEPWLDTNGDVIRAHSGGLLADPSGAPVYYWYGSDGYPGGDAMLNRKINVYSSVDLYNWEPKGVAFTMPNLPLCAGGAPSGEVMTCYADRCHVLYNDATSKYVMWCKAKPFVAVATSDSPTGPFTIATATSSSSSGDPTGAGPGPGTGAGADARLFL